MDSQVGSITEAFHNYTLTTERDDCCKLVSDEARVILETALYIVIAGLFGLLGIGTNSVNIVVFMKQGLSESSNISLFCLAVSDFFISLWTLMASLCYILAAIFPNGPVDITSFYLVTIGNPLVYLSKLSMVTTMFLCVERCLCVVRPFAVKSIFTRRRTVLILGFAHVELTVSYGVYFAFDFRLSWQFDKTLNMTRLSLQDHPVQPSVGQLNRSINGSFLMTFCAVIVLVSSIVMIIGVYSTITKRGSLVSSNSGDVSRTSGASSSNTYVKDTTPSGLNKKDIRLIKIVIYVAVLFLVSYLPILGAGFVEAVIEPELHMKGKYHNLNEVLWSLIRALGAVNAAGNFVIYYAMSDRYRAVLKNCIGKS